MFSSGAVDGVIIATPLRSSIIAIAAFEKDFIFYVKNQQEHTKQVRNRQAAKE